MPRCRLVVAGLAAAAVLSPRLPGGLRPPAARRRRAARRRHPGHRRVRRRPRPGAAVRGEGRRRHGRLGREDRAQRLDRQGDAAAARRRQAARQRRRPSSSRPACSGRSTSSWPPRPTRQPEGRLGDGDNIPLDRTGRNPEVEEVLSALSLLLNGGGVAQLKIIETELNNALSGNQTADPRPAQAARHLRRRPRRSRSPRSSGPSTTSTSSRPARRAEATTSPRAGRALPGGLKVLADQRKQLRPDARPRSSRLGAVGTEVIRQSKDDTVANLKALDADPGPADQGRRRPAQVAAAAADLPLPRQRDRRDQGRLHQPVGRHSTSTCSNLAGNLGLPTALPPPGSRPAAADRRPPDAARCRPSRCRTGSRPDAARAARPTRPGAVDLLAAARLPARGLLCPLGSSSSRAQSGSAQPRAPTARWRSLYGGGS